MGNKTELLKKLEALANDTRGNEEERNTAKKMLENLMKKHGITEEDLGKIEMKERKFWYGTPWEYKLAHQLVYSMMEDRPVKHRTNANMVGFRGWVYIDMTDAEYIEFEYKFGVYKGALWNEMDIFYTAFLQKNKIFPDRELTDEEREEIEKKKDDPKEKAKRMRASMMAEGIEFTVLRKGIGDGGSKNEDN